MDLQSVASVNKKFCLDLFKTIFKDKKEENVFISPFSISLALSMTQLGAKGTTAQGMAKALCWSTENGDKIHEQFKAYITMLQSPSDKFSLSTANRIYMQQDYKIEEDFKAKAKDFYLSEPVNADFVAAAETERSKINNWVEEQTQNKIKDLIAAGILDSLTRMVIVNATYFKGDWDVQFNQHKTQPQTFKVSPGQTKSVPMMNTEEKYAMSNCEDLKCRAIEIPYKNKELSMVVILPMEDFGLQDLIKELNHEKMEQILRGFGPAMGKVNLTLPKFEVTSSHSLRDSLSHLGMSDAFSQETADFSGITGSQDLYISAVIHKAFVKVNEEGTEAAAATAVTMRMRCAPMRAMPFVVDHPFLYIIRDNRANGMVLFIGVIVDPSQ